MNLTISVDASLPSAARVTPEKTRDIGICVTRRDGNDEDKVLGSYADWGDGA